MFRPLAAVLLVAALTGASPPKKFTLTSPDVQQGKQMADAQVFNAFGCTGQNISPALAWSDAPAGTKSFAVTIYDPDAPTGSGWWHWVVYNIPATTTSLPAGAGDPTKHLLPAGAAHGMTDFGTTAYGGPCPPKGDKPHRYQITVFALKVDKIQVSPGSSGAMVGYNLRANALAKAEITPVFKR